MSTYMFSNGQQGAVPLVTKRSLVVCKLMRNYLSKWFSNEFMVSVTSCKSSTRHDAHFVNHGPIQSKIGDKQSVL